MSGENALTPEATSQRHSPCRTVAEDKPGTNAGPVTNGQNGDANSAAGTENFGPAVSEAVAETGRNHGGEPSCGETEQCVKDDSPAVTLPNDMPVIDQEEANAFEALEDTANEVLESNVAKSPLSRTTGEEESPASAEMEKSNVSDSVVDEKANERDEVVDGNADEVKTTENCLTETSTPNKDPDGEEPAVATNPNDIDPPVGSPDTLEPDDPVLEKEMSKRSGGVASGPELSVEETSSGINRSSLTPTSDTGQDVVVGREVEIASGTDNAIVLRTSATDGNEASEAQNSSNDDAMSVDEEVVPDEDAPIPTPREASVADATVSSSKDADKKTADSEVSNLFELNADKATAIKSGGGGDVEEVVEMELQIASVSGAECAKTDDASSSASSSAEGTEPSKTTADHNDDVVQIIDDVDDDGKGKKKPVLKLASFAGMSAGGSDTADNPKKHNKISGCAQCIKLIESGPKTLVWETMRFCNSSCLGDYQNTMSNCSTCKKPVHKFLIGKYCVRFGLDIKQFCSNICLEDHKKGLMVCCYCQKDISGCDGFLAPIGDKGQFRDFCDQKCLQRYEELNCGKTIEKPVEPCAVCSSDKPVEVKLILHPKDGASQKVVQLCSSICFSAYKFTSNYETSECDLCKAMFWKPNDDFVEHVIHYGGKMKRFCSAACQNVFVMKSRDIVPCMWCKVRKYNFDMIEMRDEKTSSFKHFCSFNCYNRLFDPKTGVASKSPPSKTSAASSMPVIQSVSSLAGAGIPPAQADRLPTHPIPSAHLQAAAAAASVVPQVQIQTQTVTKTTKETLVKLPDVKEVRNKSIMTKPSMMTKGVSCKPHPCYKSTQTEGPSLPVLVPLIVPVYVPFPMAMYAKPYPVPVPVPLPVPVPIFIPTSRNTYAGVAKQINKIRSKVPTDPFEAEMLAMAGALVDKKSQVEQDDDDDSESDAVGGGDDDDTNNKHDVDSDVVQHPAAEDLESDIRADRVVPKPLPVLAAEPFPMQPPPPPPHGQNKAVTSKPAPQRNSNSKRRYSGKEDTDEESADDNNSWQPETRRTASTRRRRKRYRNDNAANNDTNSVGAAAAAAAVSQLPKERPDANHHLKFTYGVNAWKHWVVGKNCELEKARSQGKYVKNFQTDLLQLRADELNYTLCMFVKEVKKPNNDSYAADSVLYLAYGIQEYLFENGRIDNIFTDQYYEPFTSALHEVVKDFKLPMNELGYYVTRIEEEHLWEAKQLGAHSPQVLLNTLVYFNTKYFMLRTAEDHRKLSFAHIMKHWKKSSPNKEGGGQKSIVLRYHCQAKRGQRNDDRKCYEQQENVDSPLRCPVKLYEFYLSKCPDNTKSRSDLFYLMPERSCVPDSPVWFSSQVLPLHQLDKMLQRNLMVREVQEHMLADVQ